MKCQSCRVELPKATKLSQRTVVCPGCGHENALVSDLEPTQVGSGTRGPAVSPKVDLLIGRTVGRGAFRIDEFLGAGGMGRVYRGEQLSLKRPVAIKVLHDTLAADQEFVRRFRREASTLAGLEHPNIVRVYETGDEDELFYIVMALLSGPQGKPQTLSSLIEAQGELDTERAYRTMEQACSALEFAHAQGIVHRDIKPGNFLLDQFGHLMLADFGIAAVRRPGVEMTMTGAGSSMGSVGYMSPEQRKNASAVDHRSDIYALGVVFYEILVGEKPDFSLMVESAPGSESGFVWPSRVRADVPPAIDGVIRKALQGDPAKRYQSAREMWEAIDAARRQATVSGAAAAGVKGSAAGGTNRPATHGASTGTKHGRSTRSVRRRLLTPILGGIAVAVLVTAFWGDIVSALTPVLGSSAEGDNRKVPTPADTVAERKGNGDIAATTLSTGPSVTPEPAGDPAAFVSENKYAELRGYLRQNPAALNQKDADGRTLLHRAVAAGSLDCVNVLLEQGAEVSAKDQQGRSVVHLAADAGNEAMLKRLLDAPAPAVNEPDNDGNTPLHLAVRNGSLACVQLLVSKGADTRAKNRDDQTPLAFFTPDMNQEIKRLLLGDGLIELVRRGKVEDFKTAIRSQPDLRDKADANGDTALLVACQTCQLDLIDFLVNEQAASVNAANNAKQTPLRALLEGGCTTTNRASMLDMARLLVSKGASADWVGPGNDSAFMTAAKANDLELLTILVNASVKNPADANNEGMTPICHVWLNWTPGGDRTRALELLTRAGGRLACTDGEQNSMLHLAAIAKDKAALENLIRDGRLNINQPNRSGDTPLHLASGKGDEWHEIADLLLRGGANVQSQNNGKDTPLHVAAASGSMRIVQLLIAGKAGVTVRNAAGRTPAEAARAAGHGAVADYLDSLLRDVPPPNAAPSLAAVAFKGSWNATFVSGAGRAGQFTLRILSDERRGECELVTKSGSVHKGTCIINKTDGAITLVNLEPKVAIDSSGKPLSTYEGAVKAIDEHTLEWTVQGLDPLTVRLERSR